jgi:iron complex transport system ATP-binding protein
MSASQGVAEPAAQAPVGTMDVPRFALSAKALSASLGKRQVLHSIDLDIVQGQWTSILGPNGAGKSTLLKALAGLLPHSGTVALLGAPMRSIPQRQRARQLAWLGQNEASADDLSAWDVTMLGRLPHQAWLAPPNEQDTAAVERALRYTQAWDWRHRPLGQLSGGERQRVGLHHAQHHRGQRAARNHHRPERQPPGGDAGRPRHAPRRHGRCRHPQRRLPGL